MRMEEHGLSRHQWAHYGVKDEFDWHSKEFVLVVAKFGIYTNAQTKHKENTNAPTQIMHKWKDENTNTFAQSGSFLMKLFTFSF